MPISTDNGKLAIMELDQDYEPGLPLSPGALGQDDQQQLLWGFPEILWAAAAAAPDSLIIATYSINIARTSAVTQRIRRINSSVQRAIP